MLVQFAANIMYLFNVFVCRMIATMTKLGEGAFADVFGCQKEGWDKLAIKVSLCVCYSASLS